MHYCSSIYDHVNKMSAQAQVELAEEPATMGKRKLKEVSYAVSK
jgi:hypothetical protein